jgi:hypothetical protein
LTGLTGLTDFLNGRPGIKGILQFGFQESAYCRALEHVLRSAGQKIECEKPIPVPY